jgi:hypothetical protein
MRKFEFLKKNWAGSKKNSAQSKMVGVFLPRSLDCYMNLYCIVNKVTKSDLMRELVHNWYNSKSSVNPKSNLVNMIISKANAQWQSEKDVRNYNVAESHVHFKSYKEDLKWSLEKKGLDYVEIGQILKSIKQ